MGVNLIPDDDDDAQVPANDNIDNKNMEDAEAIEVDDDTASVAHPMSNKTLCTMKQLSTFYNPLASNYIQANLSNDDTIATSHQLGRDEAAEAEDSDANSDASSKTHDWRKTICQVKN